MILTTLVINTVTHRVANRYYSLANPWNDYVLDYGNIELACDYDYGGYCRPSGGSISFLPSLFDSDWPPPMTIGVTIAYTATTEAAAVTLLKASGFFRSLSRDAVNYDLYGYDDDSVVTEGTVFSAQTITQIFTTIFGASYLNISLDVSKDRATLPAALGFTLDQDMPALDFLSDLAASLTHMFYIDDTPEGFLIDVLADNNTHTVDEFQFLPPVYEALTPVSEVTGATYTDNAECVSAGNYPFGQSESAPNFYGTSVANTETAFDNIVTVMDKRRMRLSVPLSELSTVVPGDKISWTDTRLYTSTDAYLRVRSMVYDLNREIVTYSGDGAISTAS